MSPQKTVLYVITKANWGGAQRYVWDLMTHAKEYGYAPALAYGEHGLLAERAEAAGFPTHRVHGLRRDVSPLKEFAAKRELRELFKKLAPDVVHLNSSKAGYTGGRAAKEAGVPRTVFTSHGWAFTEPRSALARRIFKMLQKKTVLMSDATVAVSDFIATETRRWNLPAGRVRVIRHGIGALPFLSREDARAELIRLDASLSAAAEKTWVGTIAELHRNKGIDIGIEAWKSARPEAEWLVIGGGEEHGKLTAHASGEASIHLLGFVPDASKYLKAFDLFMLPSRTEALGYVVLEAGAAGVPVIASDYGGAKEALGNEPADMLFKSENPDDLARKLNALLNDQSLETTGQALKAYIEQNFSLKRMLDETFLLYR